MTQEQITTQFAAKVARGIFNPVARHLKGPEAEDRLQEGLALTYESYRHYILDHGKVLEDGILVHSCRQRAVDLTRHFVKTDYQPRRDVLHPLNFKNGQVQVLRLDGLVNEDGEFVEETTAAFTIGLGEATSTDPTDKLLSAIDLQAWLEELPDADQELLALRLAGSTLKEVATHLRISITAAFERLRTLGRELAYRSGLPVPSSRPLPA